MNKKKLLLLLFCCIYYTGFSQIIYVNQLLTTGNQDGTSWENAFVDVQNALSIATAGSQIWVAQGIYIPSQNLDQTTSFELKDEVEMYGGFCGNETTVEERKWENSPTILSGDLLQNDSLDFTNMEDNSYCVIYSNKVSAATVLDGFIISGGYANDPNAGSQSRGQSGGAWFNRGSFGISNPTVRNCTFTNNQANYFGGVLYNNGGFQGQTNMTFENCEFIHNQSLESGGGIYNNGSFDGESSPTFERCVFRDNVSISGSGGLFYNNGAQGISNPVYTNCIFSDNHANGDNSYGGVAYNMGKGKIDPPEDGDASPIFINCLFLKNKAISGGVMYNLGSEGGQSNPQLINCTLYDNYGEVSAGTLNNNAGGIDDLGTSESTVKNCIFWNNRTNGIGPVFKNNNGSVVVENCLISTTDCDELNVGTGSTTTCNMATIFDTYPMFTDTTNGDFSLLSNSPAQNMGDNNSLPSGIMEDLAGQERISEDIIDLGAFEICGMPCEVLPMELLVFSATMNAPYVVDLYWETASEQQTDFFEIERAVDAHFFKTIQQIKAAGTSTQKQYYSWTDTEAELGHNYYRLKIVNQDGTFEYSDIQMLDIAKNITSISIYPNPSSGQIAIDIIGEKNKLESVEVYNALGLLVYENRKVEKMDLRRFGAGVYWVVIKIGGVIYTERVMVEQ